VRGELGMGGGRFRRRRSSGVSVSKI
jgi:hypothetical protein